MKYFLAIFTILLSFAVSPTTQRIWPGGGYGNQREKDVKYVITFPAMLQKSRDFPFHLILFKNESAYNLPIIFTANLSVGLDVIASQEFQQNYYGLQEHIFTNIKSATLPVDSWPTVTVEFKNKAFGKFGEPSVDPRIVTENYVFIQTDKAMYKPTHDVKMRVIVVDRELKPVNGKVNVTMQDPMNNYMRKWTRNLESGVVTLNYQLSDFVNMGNWKILVSGITSSSDRFSAEKMITVKQYVLPKFEVALDFSHTEGDYLLYNPNSEDGYYGYVRPKYTFGKGVRGKAVVEMTSTGGCNYNYDYPDRFLPIPRPVRILINRDDDYSEPPVTTKAGPERLIFEVDIKADGSADDGKFLMSGLNKYLAPPDSPEMSSSTCNLQFKVNVTEELTGELVSSDGHVTVHRHPYIISVHDSVQKTLKPGLPFTMRIQVASPNGEPAVGQRVKLEAWTFNQTTSQLYSKVSCYQSRYAFADDEDEAPAPLAVKTVETVTDQDGVVSIDVIPEKNTTTVLFKATLLDKDIKMCESRYTPSTESGQAISISIDNFDKANIPKTGDLLTFSISSTLRTPVVYFMIVQNGVPLVYQQLIYPIAISDSSTEFKQQFEIPLKAAPRSAAVVWTVENKTGEVLADAVEFKVDGLIQQTVSAQFGASQVRPGQDTSVNVKTSEGNAMVGLLAIDKSVRLLKSGNDITVEDLMRAIGEGQQLHYGGLQPAVPLIWRCWQCGWWPSWFDSSSADSVFGAVGMMISSNVKTSGPMLMYARAFSPVGGSAPGAPSGATAGSGDPGQKVRMLFPETWIWEDRRTNLSGSLTFPVTAPDSITTWELSAFAIGQEKGFGLMAEPAENLFVNLDIGEPTIIRGEKVQASAVVFNYGSNPAQVTLELRESDDFDVSKNGDDFRKTKLTWKLTVPPSDGKSIPVWINPKRLGLIEMHLSGRGATDSDAIIKKALVEPEGEVQYSNKPTLIQLDASNRNMQYAIEVADMLDGVQQQQIVPGSRMFQLQTIGDIMGPSLTEIGSQVRLPTGCGEQTMVILAPNVYIYKYLKSKDALTNELETKTTSFIDQGVQHELTYQRKDGGFSAFGNSDNASSTWLTAFVLRSFAAAQKYVNTEIPEEPIAKAWRFLMGQLSNGKFKEDGEVLHKSMKGGSTSEDNLAVYVYTTAAEAGYPLMDELVQTRQLMSRLALESLDPYQLSLISYAASILDSDREIANQAYLRLMRMANRTSDFVYWTPSNGVDESESSYHSEGPSSIETSAYALLAHLNLNQALSNAIPIGRWLMSKRNSLGGFISTQDTVVGLHALSELAAKLRSAGQDFTVSARFNVENGPTQSHTFVVNRTNTQILQQYDLDRDIQQLRSVDLRVQGTGVGLVQLAMKYHLADPKQVDSGDFNILVSQAHIMARRRRSANDLAAIGSVPITACVQPKQSETEMTNVEVGVPTGYEANLEATLDRNQNSRGQFRVDNLKRIELGERRIIYYFSSLAVGVRTCVDAVLDKLVEVADVKMPTVRVYAYYEPRKTNAVEYTFDALQELNSWDLCQSHKFNFPCPQLVNN